MGGLASRETPEQFGPRNVGQEGGAPQTTEMPAAISKPQSVRVFMREGDFRTDAKAQFDAWQSQSRCDWRCERIADFPVSQTFQSAESPTFHSAGCCPTPQAGKSALRFDVVTV